MKGGIYSDQSCSICGSRFIYDGRKGGLFCPKHESQCANGKFRVHFGRDTQKIFKTFDEAERFLTGVRFASDQGTFDPRNYKKDAPLGFRTLSEKWLSIKERDLAPGTLRIYTNYINRGISLWGSRNIKTIEYADLEDFLYAQDVSDKTRSNIRACLHAFWNWLLKRKVITQEQFPEFPEIKYNLGYRTIIDKDTLQAILDEIKSLTYHQNPKIWLGIKWLATYISIRPNELLQIKEQDIDTQRGYFIVKHTKEGKEKFVPILPEDIDFINQFPTSFPHLPFFRHVGGHSGYHAGQQFGKKYFYKWWKRACKNLGIDNVDLYGGTRHSTATALRQFLSPEEIKVGTMHSTNKAFERYLQIRKDDALSVYKLARNGKHVANQS